MYRLLLVMAVFIVDAAVIQEESQHLFEPGLLEMLDLEARTNSSTT